MRYLFSKAILAAEGIVVIEIEADNQVEAEKAAKQEGNGKWVFDQVQVTKLSDPVFLGMGRGVKAGNA